jgi:hypothetical protein
MDIQKQPIFLLFVLIHICPIQIDKPIMYILSDKKSTVFWPRFYIVVLGMTFFFSFSYLLFPIFIWILLPLFYLDFSVPFVSLSFLDFSFFITLIYFFQFLFGLLFPFSLWTFISLFSLDFYFPFLFGLLFSLFSLDFDSIAVTFWISSKTFF